MLFRSVVALSSCEAELFSLTTSLQEGIGLRSLLGEIGFRVRFRAHCDSSAALAVASRRGLGRLKHVSLRQLWVQQEVAKKTVILLKIEGAKNPADIGTKHLPATRLAVRKELVGVVHGPGPTRNSDTLKEDKY